MPLSPYETEQVTEVPLKIVGGNNFGRYPKISKEQTWNMIVSDDGLVIYAGYKSVLSLVGTNGRGIFETDVGDFMISVVGTNVYRISGSVSLEENIGSVATSTGTIFMTENNNKEILITDGTYVYLYAYGVTPTVFYSNAPGATNPLTFTHGNAGYCSFQNGRFIVAINGTNSWVLSEVNDGQTWPTTAAYVGSIQSKPGFIQAAIPMPGGGNNLLVLGDNVGESWQDVGAALFPYQRNSTFNIDYGVINPATIAGLENFVVWLATNEQTGPVIMYTQGSGVKTISTDGINFKLSRLEHPEDVTGFLFKQDGHLIYQITWPQDNLSYIYDFNTGLFFTVTDEDLNYHPARQVVFFNNTYYFVSLKDGGIYDFSTKYTDATYADGVEKVIPRLRITPPLRLPSQRFYIASSLGFTIENGEINDEYTTQKVVAVDYNLLGTESSNVIGTESGNDIAIDDSTTGIETITQSSAVIYLSVSRDGGEIFGSSWGYPMNATGHRRSRLIWQRLGIANDSTYQLRFSGLKRFIAFDGVVEIYQ